MALSKVNPNFVNVSQVGGRRNLIINGGMQVAQRGTSATVSDNSNEGYSTLDRWLLNFNAAPGGALDFSQSTDAPDGFANSIKLACSTADASHTGTEQILLVQYIEAQNLQQLAYGTSNAKSITISWYMKAVNFSGPISLALETEDGTAEYYVVSKTPTSSWARYSVTIPGSSSATINNNTGTGLRVKFGVAGSSSGTYAAAADSTAWSTTRADYRNDIGNLVSSTSNDFYITGVQMEVGDTATPFEHRSYGEELSLCQRYFFNPLFGRTTGSIYYPIHFNQVSTGNNGLLRWQVTFPVSMRTSPSFTHSLTDAKFQTSAPNGTDNWAFYKQNSGWASKVGNSDISVLNIAPSVNQANVGAYYVTPGDTLATAIGIGGGATFNFNSEL